MHRKKRTFPSPPPGSGRMKRAGSRPKPKLKGAAGLEDCHVWQMEKVRATKKGPENYTY